MKPIDPLDLIDTFCLLALLFFVLNITGQTGGDDVPQTHHEATLPLHEQDEVRAKVQELCGPTLPTLRGAGQVRQVGHGPICEP